MIDWAFNEPVELEVVTFAKFFSDDVVVPKEDVLIEDNKEVFPLEGPEGPTLEKEFSIGDAIDEGFAEEELIETFLIK